MTIKELQSNLLEAYTNNNLNKISHTLIDLYKNQQWAMLQKIAEIISDLVVVEITSEGKGFSKFMMLYHPDRAGYHINEINRLADQNKFDELLGYSHILKLERIEEISASLCSYEDIDYSPEYEWDIETEGFSIINDYDQVEPRKAQTTKTTLNGYNFYDAIKVREYGHTEIEYPTFYLEDIEEFELSSSDIIDLDGIQFCKHARTIDISNNRISDISPLLGLSDLEELNLSDNEIGIIDELSSLKSLRSVQLSNNNIEDISPLFELEKLEYADLSGNKIDIEQLNKLEELGITVNFD
jgi:Leucine-rich repeat (LRR) protein